MSAVAIGFRSQAAWLTLPLLVLAIADRAGRGAAGALVGGLFWLAAGTLLWFVPLVIASGGPGAYYAAFSAQAGEDWSGVDLLANGFTRSRAGVRALRDVHPPLGRRRMVRRRCLRRLAPRSCSGAAGARCWRSSSAFVPYAVFHLLFQETVTTRYALPLVPAVAYLSTRGLYARRRWAG